MISTEGQHFCEGCKSFKNPGCSVYFPEGQVLRIRLGHCPAAMIPKVEEGNRFGMWAHWREDKPKPVKAKKRVGQKKGSSYA